ncbi:hypothetical protein EDD21DRAFT_420909 [Dissophora ornata]|nr:hypothetical protein EDD21DRAFT_420909 [Dissophora ornata]
MPNMAALTLQSSRTRQRPTPPDLVLHDTNISSLSRFQTISSSNSSSSINSQPSYQHQQHQHGAFQGQGRQAPPYSPFNPDAQSGGGGGLGSGSGSGGGGGGGGGGVTQFQPYNAHYPSYRPYTPTTPTLPTTPTALHALSIPMPMTPTAAAFSVSTPRSEHSLLLSSSSSSSQGNKLTAGTRETGSNTLYPSYSTKSQRASSTRRMPSNESSLVELESGRCKCCAV